VCFIVTRCWAAISGDDQSRGSLSKAEGQDHYSDDCHINADLDPDVPGS
jgi:hypothetical protein